MKILVAVDDSPYSDQAVEFVTRMRWPAGSRMIVISVVPNGPVRPEAPAFVPEAPGAASPRRRRRQAAVARAERALREAGFSTEGRLVEGDPRAALIAAARNERVGLIVAGAHGRSGFLERMLGSVSSHMVTHAGCSVLVIKPGAGA